jgi:serine/threonine protein kinase
MADITGAFAAVIGKNRATTAAIIDSLSENRTIANYSRPDGIVTRFISEVTTLDEVALDDAAGTVLSRGREIDRIRAHQPGDAGTYGVVFRSTDGRRVYKNISFPRRDDGSDDARRNRQQALPGGVPSVAYFEKKIRDVYIETFIQVILSSDPTVGRFICRVTHLYRNPRVRRPLRGDDPNLPRDSYTLYIDMEPNPHKFDDWINSLPRPLDLRSFGHILIQLGQTLDHLRRTYAYSHRDLHTGNIMLSDTFQLKLIDFGFSCLTYGGNTYRQVDTAERARGCVAGYDLAIFFTNFYQKFSRLFNPELEAFFQNNLGARAPFNVLGHGMDQVAQGNVGVWFHAFYHWEMYRRTADGSRLHTQLARLPILDPAQMPGIVRRAMDAPAMGRGPATGGPGGPGLFSPGLRHRGAPAGTTGLVGTSGAAASPGWCDGLYNATLGMCFPRRRAGSTARQGRKTREARKTRKTRSNRK